MGHSLLQEKWDLTACDYGITEAFEGVEIDFPTTVADGEDQPCQMVIRKRKN
jgi:hypothetical protein